MGGIATDEIGLNTILEDSNISGAIGGSLGQRMTPQKEDKTQGTSLEPGRYMDRPLTSTNTHSQTMTK